LISPAATKMTASRICSTQIRAAIGAPPDGVIDVGQASGEIIENRHLTGRYLVGGAPAGARTGSFDGR
jgi:hypothetical protein